MQIDSVKNPRVKAVMKLWSDGAERRERGLFAVEGTREISRALACGYRAQEAFIRRDLLDSEALDVVRQLEQQDAEILDVSAGVYAKLAVREEQGGIVCVMKMREHALADLALPANPFILAAENVENPGNVGALLRSADGAGTDAFVLIDYKGDLYNPHAIRASLGAVFSVPIALCTAAEFVGFCHEKKIRMVGAALDARSKPVYEEDFTKACAVILGSEADGLTPALMDACDALTRIPMRGIADSLNVSAAGAVIAYEVVRQRSM